jgi:putative restriction endonuclease
MNGYVAVTHKDWFDYLSQRTFWEEVNFWRPSAHHGFNGPPGSPFFFKLKAPHNAIGGFGLVAKFSRLPDWLAWECFGEANGAATFREMEQRLNIIRVRNRFIDAGPVPQIGCILLGSAVFFPRDLWIPQPSDWSPRNLTYQRYDLEEGEGLRIWRNCQERLTALRAQSSTFPVSAVAEVLAQNERYGPPRLVRPRLGQGTFRVAVTDAYGRACSITAEHSLPVLEASHIKPYSSEGPHEIANGLLLRADLHRLFDQGYVTVTPDHRLEVSKRLKVDYDNGRTYYPLHGGRLNLPEVESEWPSDDFLRWHNENVFRG